MAKVYSRRYLRNRRKELRKFGTSAEAVLWTLLKGKQLEGRKFRRQHSIGKYIVDFYCPSEKLVIELDGEYHFTEERIAHDAKKTQFLNELGISVLRFENYDVFERQDAVLRDIVKMFKDNRTE